MSERIPRVSCWMITNKDAQLSVRAGAWEVSFPDDQKRLNTVCFSGPDARRLAHDYAEYMAAWFIAQELLG